VTRSIPVVALALVLAASGALLAAPKPPPAHIPWPIAISRVRFDVRAGRVLVTTDVMLPAGREPFGDLDVHVSYGGPGVPLGIDAQLLETPRGFLSPPTESAGTRLSQQGSFHSPSHAAFTLGRADMAGMLVHIPASVLVDKLKPSGQATLRVREVRDLPHPLADGTRELLARLGSHRGRPFVLGMVELATDGLMARAEAHFCSAQAPRPNLFVAGSAGAPTGVAPPLASRSPSDDLCLRFGAARASAASSTAPRQSR
jgi:hypothetical protein